MDNDTYQTISQLLSLHGKPTYLKLKRERDLYKSCESTFSAPTALVDDYGHISKQLRNSEKNSKSLISSLKALKMPLNILIQMDFKKH